MKQGVRYMEDNATTNLGENNISENNIADNPEIKTAELVEINSGMEVPEILLSKANEMMDTMLDIKDLMLGYSAAIQIIKAKLAILDKEFAVRYQRNPISNIHSRLKSQVSIMGKLERKGMLINRDNIEENIFDVAGVRVVCNYEDDIYRLADALKRQEDIDVVRIKDYIENPKPNGYRSLHMIVKVPVNFEEYSKKVYAEIQIRTIAMDFWASLEHQMKYKKHIENPEEMAARLKKCADIICFTDRVMLDIRKEMDGAKSEQTDVEMLMEKLERFGVTLEE